MKTHVKENNGSKSASAPPITTDEKAQYEVFTNGKLPRETIEKWVRNDLTATLSLISGALNDPDIFKAVVDAYYKKYTSLHTKTEDDGIPRT